MQGYNLEERGLAASTNLMFRQPLGVVADHHAVQLPRDDPAVVPPLRHSLRQHAGAQTLRARARLTMTRIVELIEAHGHPQGRRESW